MRGIGTKLQITKWGMGQQSLKEKEIKVSVEIVLKKLERYVIKNYLYYLLNLEVSITQPTVYRQVIVKLLTFGRHVTDSQLTDG